MFEVGKLVWFVNTVSPGIKLMLVSEEIVKKSLEGETREYVFQAAHAGKQKNFQSVNLTGEFFNDREEAFEFMLRQAGEAINNMLEKADKSYRAVYPSELQPPFGAVGVLTEPTIEEAMGEILEDIIVELPDGTKARMKGDALK